MKCPRCKSTNQSDSKFCRECAEPLLEVLSVTQTQTLDSAWKDLSAGSVFARKYQIVEELGKGGMGRVYRAFDSEIEEYVAIKLIRPEIASDKTIIQRFRNELKLARKISHKNVCRMFDLNRDKDVYYITMEYVQGEDLKSALRRMGPLSLGKAIFIAKQVCDGLSEAHRLGVIHRDLKPQNIMIDWDGNARILDFGIARSRETSGITDSGGVIGTAEYMSPEQVEGIDVDIRSDIYSLGIILYELVTGCVPFDGNTPMSVAIKRMLQKPTEPRKINSRIPGELSNIIMTCINKDKEKRYPSAKALLLELSKIETQLPATDNIIPRSRSYTTKEITVSFKPKKVLIVAASICMLAAAGILLWIFVLKSEVPPPIPTPSSEPEPAITVLDKQDLEAKPNEKVSLEKAGVIEDSVVTKPKTPVKKNVTDNKALARKRAAEKQARLELEINNALNLTKAAFEQEDFAASLKHADEVLLLAPDNVTAAEYARLADKELVTAYIESLVEQFNTAVQTRSLLDFYLMNCTAALYKKIKKDTELILNTYSELNSVTSENSLQFFDPDHLQVVFPNIIMGKLKQNNRQQVLFEGRYIWEMERKEAKWLITSIKTSAVKKNIK